MLSRLSVADYGAIPDDGNDDRAAIQAAINDAGSGDTIAFDDGTYNIRGHIQLRSGLTMTADHRRAATLEFLVSSGDGTSYAMRAGSLSDFTFTGLAVRSNNGIFDINRQQNTHFTDNDLQWGYHGNYYHRLAFHTRHGADGLVIENNYFHDSPHSDRNLEIWGWQNGSYSYNTFYDVNDGGHIMNPGDNLHMSFNTGRLIHRMGIEVQQDQYPPHHLTRGFTVEGNTFYDWNKPYWDSMGLSVPLFGRDTRVINNYIQQNPYNGVWGHADHSGRVRGSYGIEGPQGSGSLVEGNTVGGERMVQHVSCPGRDTLVQNNRFFGSASWGSVSGEPGALGTGSAIEKHNQHGGLDEMPAPPEQRPAPSTPDHPVQQEQQLSSDGSTPLSSLRWTSARSGWGAVEINRSNGGKRSSDGLALTLNGTRYSKGLGVAVNSQIIYALRGKYDTLLSDIGIDDEVDNKGSMTFAVWADGRKIFDSGRLTGADAAKSIQLDVKGVQQLKLVTTNAGDGDNSDHGDWAGARLLPPADA